MRCRRARRSLLAALDGELAPVEREALDAHVSGCEACRALGAESARLHRALATMPQTAEVPAGLAEATLRRVRAELVDEPSRWWQPDTRGTWWWMAAPVAATLAGVLVWRSLPGRTVPSEPAQVVANRPVEPAAQKRSEPRAAKPAPAAVPAAPAGPAGTAGPPPQVAEALELFLEMPILENMEKLQNYDAIRTVDGGNGGQGKDRHG